MSLNKVIVSYDIAYHSQTPCIKVDKHVVTLRNSIHKRLAYIQQNLSVFMPKMRFQSALILSNDK